MDVKKIKKRKKSLRVFIVLAVLAFAAMAVLVSPLFAIRQFVVTGIYVLNEGEIIEASGLAAGQNMLSFSARNIANQISVLPYVGNVVVKREFPGNITIIVTERVAIANVQVANSALYLQIDDAGMVLTTSTGSPRHGLPVVTGVGLSHFAVGEYLDVDDNFVFDSIFFLSRIFRRYEFLPDIMDMSCPTDIVLRLGSLDILFGSTEDADRKVQYIQAILEQFTIENRGYIYIRDANVSPRFGLIR